MKPVNMDSFCSRMRCAAAAVLLFAAGCYYNRNTFNLDKFKELSSEDSAVLEVAAVNDEENTAALRDILRYYEGRRLIYTINSGDVISVTVYNNPDISLAKTLVTTDGCISMVLAGQVKVAGLTPDEASLAVEKRLAKYIHNPKVGISPLEIRSTTATIGGAVNKPGMFTISNGMRLTDIYALAGGPQIRSYDGMDLDAVDLERAVFVRDGKALPVNFTKAIEHGDPLHNLKLHHGDYIYMPGRGSSMVYLVGDVKNPQRRIWTQNLGLLEFLAVCGWINESYWHHVIIIRGGIAKPRFYKVDLDGILQGRKSNVLLEPGDVVYMPHDDISEYNVFIRKLFPTAQLLNMISTPMFWHTKF